MRREKFFCFWYHFLLGSFLIVLLEGCTPAIPQDRTGQPGVLLPPATLGATLVAQQHLTFKRENVSHVIEVAVEADENTIDLVGMVMGKRVLSLTYDGANLDSWRHAMLPQQVQAQDVLENMQLAFWPLDVIRSKLPSSWEVREDGQERIYSHNGEQIIFIRYDSQDRWQGVTWFRNAYYNYDLTIESVLMEK
ncbi:MAG: DUF3261 domain-containing protein [Methylobacillus sp.]|jgi:hypothetical protein|nr:DUF3261 domain-containing protein [Methylobacillus sp.]